MPILTDVLSDQPAIEVLDGRRYRKMSPRSRHGRVQGLMSTILERCGHEFGLAGTEWDFRIGVVDHTDSFFVPDAAFVRFERIAALAPKDREQPPIAPDIVVEVRSSKEPRSYRERKIERYLKCGSTLVLDIDPIKRIVYAHAAGGIRKYTEGERFEHDAAPWLVFDIAEAFVGLEYFPK